MWPTLAELISITGSVLSAVGVVIAIWQIRKVRTTAEAALQAARETKAALTRNLLLSDLTACTNAADEVKQLIRHCQYDAALLRVSDLRARLIQLQAMPSANIANNLGNALPQLAIICELLEAKVQRAETNLDSVRINQVLSSIGDAIHQLIGILKFDIAGDPDHAHSLISESDTKPL